MTTNRSPIHGSGGGGCFTGDTLVCTPNGDICIDKLKPGDIIYSFDDKGAICEDSVIAVHCHANEEVIEYTIWGGAKLKATQNHWVLNQFNAFVEIGSLGDDDCLVDENCHLRPIVKRECIGRHDVYNLTVSNRHTFIAGGIRVHNAGLGVGRIAGAGGGGSKSDGGSSPSTDPDSLNSEATATVVDLISEGEIEGFPSARMYDRASTAYQIASLKDVYFDKTQVLKSTANPTNPSSSDYNFRLIDFNGRWGTIDQPYLPGLTATENEQVVGVTVSQSYPVTRTITDIDVDAVRITIQFPALQKITDSGDIVGLSVNYQIIATGNGAAPQVVVDKTVDGRTGDLYELQHVIPLSGYDFPVAITVKRITADSDKPQKQNAFSWSSYTELTYGKLRYPGTAYVGISLSARDFASIPTRTYRIRGIKVKIPSNGVVDDVTGRIIYTGIWDGTFGAAVWTSDPAWILWDMLTNCRYGTGQFIKSNKLDKFSFYQASQYSSELVPDGKGGYEPRFSCNVVIRNQDEAYKVINDLCSVFRAMPYWSTGALMISQDRPADATFLFNNTNVTEEGFQYSGSSLKTRHTVAIVSWLDIEQQEIVYEAVEDQAGIAKYGANPVQIEGFACTSQGQARRLGEWLLYTEQYETEICTFKTSLDNGAVMTPGAIIAIADRLRSGIRRGGRIIAASTSSIVIDEALATNLPLTGSPTVMVSMPNGSTESRPVTTASGGTITVSPSFSAVPLINGVFLYNNDDQAATYWRVVSVKEEDRSIYVVNALSYNASKYDYIERGANLVRKTYLPIEIPVLSPPTSITTNSISVIENGSITNRIFISWPSVKDAAYYVVNYRPMETGSWQSIETSSPTIEFTSARTGNYELQISSVNGVGKASAPGFFTFTVNPSALPMENVSGLSAVI